MKLIKEILVLTGAFIIIYGWQHTFLSRYNVQTIGFFLILYFLISLKKKMSGTKILFGGVWDIFLLTVIVVLLVFATNGISGGMFFLLYFLAFGIAFVFEPWSIFIFCLGCCFVFSEQALSSGDVFSNFVKLGTLWLIAPLAFFFALQYKKTEQITVQVTKLKKEGQTSNLLNTDQKNDYSKEKMREKHNLSSL